MRVLRMPPAVKGTSFATIDRDFIWLDVVSLADKEYRVWWVGGDYCIVRRTLTQCFLDWVGR